MCRPSWVGVAFAAVVLVVTASCVGTASARLLEGDIRAAVLGKDEEDSTMTVAVPDEVDHVLNVEGADLNTKFQGRMLAGGGGGGGGGNRGGGGGGGEEEGVVEEEVVVATSREEGVEAVEVVVEEEAVEVVVEVEEVVAVTGEEGTTTGEEGEAHTVPRTSHQGEAVAEILPEGVEEVVAEEEEEVVVVVVVEAAAAEEVVAEGSALVIAQEEVPEEAVAAVAVETNHRLPRPPQFRPLQRHSHLLRTQVRD
ncbi:hypothetical protein KC19_7G173600 [Ceratodon purpureus]|uniref:Uncharacterized protein n=1 Tax=Ceratodon purpureus TaxID=3225 RepID=A0A8T0H7N8_CERPU|nr:hypothetical protein KC19_7G173600 [Ceratodon purpureus]